MHEYMKFGDLRVGMRVCVEGEYLGQNRVRATILSVEEHSDYDEIEGLIETSDPEARTLTLLGVRVDFENGIRILDLQRKTVGPTVLKPGTRIKTKGRILEGRQFVPIKIKQQKIVPAAQDEVEGRIAKIDSEACTLEVLGFMIECPPDIDVEV